MDKFKKDAEVPSSNVPHPPTHCSHCENEAAVIRIVVYDDAGKTHSGTFSQFGSKRNDKLSLREPFTYCRWEAWCAPCYGDDYRSDMDKLLDAERQAHPEWNNWSKDQHIAYIKESLRNVGKG